MHIKILKRKTNKRKWLIMTSEEKILMYKNMNKDNLRKIVRENTMSEEDIIIASIELGEKVIADGNYYTTEEVLENIFGKTSMVN